LLRRFQQASGIFLPKEVSVLPLRHGLDKYGLDKYGVDPYRSIPTLNALHYVWGDVLI
jgi:hypothetical protein